jgi:hypothetical protein
VKFIVTLLITLTISGICLAQNSQTLTDEKALQDLLIGYEKRTWQLYKNKDIKTLAEITSEDYVDIYPDGSLVNKQQYLNDVLQVNVIDYSLSEFFVMKPSADTAIIIYQAKVSGLVKGRIIKSHVAVTSVWAIRSGKWQNVFYRENLLEFNGKRLL